ncbi:hypothetical protein [Vibrio variabilis]|uniref:hypothetical protein n=1 Tax=Vibrio variabilis TaxID=990271 RepID=UPI0013A6F4C7|nr:hypothetical protein [Vibrio variabilis]
MQIHRMPLPVPTPVKRKRVRVEVEPNRRGDLVKPTKRSKADNARMWLNAF